MTIDERIKYAEQKRDESFSKDSVQSLVYWDGYIAALKAVKEDGAIIVNNFGKECKHITNKGHITINVGKENK